MKSKQVKLLQNQINKLTSDSFDLEAWKSATEACLIRVFGNTDSRIQQIRELKIDYGSWALRDAQGDYNPLKTCKKKGEEILLSAIDEIEILGIPISPETASSDVVSCFEKELKVAEMKDLVSILESHEGNKKLSSEIKKLLKSWNSDTKESIFEALIFKFKNNFIQ